MVLLNLHADNFFVIEHRSTIEKLLQYSTALAKRFIFVQNMEFAG